ncbi:putative necrosis-inducing factor-domain-containing protein [Nemania serpens]|nr:putative necrosis-inducing factor-domain-containing protein [Nemania serpens]
MHVTSLISIAALALSQCAQGAHTYSKLSFSTGSVCGATKWNYETSATSPKAEDCDSLAQTFHKHKSNGFTLQGWGAKETGEDGDAYLGLGTVGTCTFGVRVRDANGAPAVIASGDVSDLLEDAKTRFAKDGRVGVSGSMSCRAYWYTYRPQTIEWRIFTFGN